MKKFKYKLENILKLKDRLYEQVSMELKEASATRMHEERIRDEIALKLRFENKEFSSTTGIKCKVDKLKEKSETISYLKSSLSEQTELIEILCQKEDEIKERLIQAYKDKEVHRKLKEKKLEIFIEEEKIAEQNLLDEIVTSRYKEAQ